MTARRRAGSAAEHELVAHELAVVFAEGAGWGLIARIANVGAGRPLPHVSIEFVQRAVLFPGSSRSRMEAAAFQKMPLQRCPGGGCLPFRLRGQAGARPARERVRLVITDMADRLRRLELPHPCQGYRQPLSVLFLPVESLPILDPTASPNPRTTTARASRSRRQL